MQFSADVNASWAIAHDSSSVIGLFGAFKMFNKLIDEGQFSVIVTEMEDSTSASHK